MVTALFAGLAPAVVAVVASGGRPGRAPVDALEAILPELVALAVGAFVALSAFAVPFPVVVAAAGAIGWALGRWGSRRRSACGGG